MKFPFYTNLNDNSSASNYRVISRQRARALSASPQSFKASKKTSWNRVKLLIKIDKLKRESMFSQLASAPSACSNCEQKKLGRVN